jgi:hypothetical protein
MEVKRRLVGGVGGGHDDHPFADQHAVAIEIRLCRSREQDSRPIVVRKDQRPLDRSRRQHHRTRANLP